MNISQVQAQVLHSYEYPNGGWVLVRVHTEDGVEGLGECFVPDRDGRAAFAARDLITGSLQRVVVGRDALDIAAIWEAMYAVCCSIYDRRGLGIHALSGIDMALYDAAGKTLGIPVHKLLGGSFRERIKLYISSIYIDIQRFDEALSSTAEYAQAGFAAIKYYGWPEFGLDPHRDGNLLGQLRQAAGEQTELMLDLGRPRGLAAALQVARLIEESGARIAWWEEPLSSTDDADNLAQLSARTTLTIAAGEAELTAYAFRELIQKKAVDLLQPDLSWVGGLTEGRRIAELGRLYRIPVVPHNWGTQINFAASIHLVAAMAEGFLCEYPITPRVRGAGHPQILSSAPGQPQPQNPSPMMTELAAEPIEVADGHALVPQRPGLGIDLDEAVVEKHTLS